MLATAADVHIQPTDDVALIAQTLRHPRVYPHIIDDGCPPADEFAAVASETSALSYLGAFEGETFLGLFVVHAHNFVCWEVHTCLLPNAWGSRSIAAARACIEWVFENTTCRRLITAVPAGNELALRLATRAGMVAYGVNPQSIQRGGVLLDQTMLGISKGA